MSADNEFNVVGWSNVHGYQVIHLNGGSESRRLAIEYYRDLLGKQFYLEVTSCYIKLKSLNRFSYKRSLENASR